VWSPGALSALLALAAVAFVRIVPLLRPIATLLHPPPPETFEQSLAGNQILVPATAASPQRMSASSAARVENPVRWQRLDVLLNSRPDQQPRVVFTAPHTLELNRDGTFLPSHSPAHNMPLTNRPPSHTLSLFLLLPFPLLLPSQGKRTTSEKTTPGRLQNGLLLQWVDATSLGPKQKEKECKMCST
jgi:hypothetical protein